MGLQLGQVQKGKSVTIEVPEEKAEHLKALAERASAEALKILADASNKPGIEMKLKLAKTGGYI